MADSENGKKKLKKVIARKEARKLLARQQKKSVWFGLGMFGLVGWSVVIPTLLGLAVGIWLDNRGDSDISWTLTFFFTGLILGCFNAWKWVNKEGQISKDVAEREQDDE